jgi:hypothetical protein
MLSIASHQTFLFSLSLALSFSLARSLSHSRALANSRAASQASCGGALPTKRRKRRAVFRCHMALMFNWGLILAVAALGSRTTVQFEFDSNKVCHRRAYACAYAWYLCLCLIYMRRHKNEIIHRISIRILSHTHTLIHSLTRDQALSVLDKVVVFLKDFSNKTESGFASLTVEALKRLNTVNQRLSGLPNIQELTRQTNVSRIHSYHITSTCHKARH